MPRHSQKDLDEWVQTWRNACSRYDDLIYGDHGRDRTPHHHRAIQEAWEFMAESAIKLLEAVDLQALKPGVINE